MALIELNVGRDVPDEDLFYGKLADRFNIAFSRHSLIHYMQLF